MKQIFIKLIKIYQVSLASFFGGNCIYYPSCSEYAIEAINSQGILKGFLKSFWRILRCNPFSMGGYDPAKH
jgi:putative membrane protein insertion efficiency factor